jgi:hypothetical protein
MCVYACVCICRHTYQIITAIFISISIYTENHEFTAELPTSVVGPVQNEDVESLGSNGREKSAI